MKSDGSRRFREVAVRFLYVLPGLALCMAACSQHRDPVFFGYWDEVQPAAADPSGPIEQFVFHPDGSMVRNVVIDTSISSSMGLWEARRQADSSWQLSIRVRVDGSGSPATYHLTFDGSDRFDLRSDEGGWVRTFQRTTADTAIGVAIDSTDLPVPVVSLWSRAAYFEPLAAHLGQAAPAPAEAVKDLMSKVERSWQQARQQLRWGRRFRQEKAQRLQAADSARALAQTALADSLIKLADINEFQRQYHLNQSYMYETIAEHYLKRCDLELPGTRALVRTARPLVKDTTRAGG